jgi:hypothetical protein
VGRVVNEYPVKAGQGLEGEGGQSAKGDRVTQTEQL